MSGHYSGVTYPNLPFTLRFTQPDVTHVVGGNVNVFGHAILCFGPDVGYIHVDEVHNYPKLIPADSFERYLTENGKHVFHREPLTDLTDPAAALAEAERLRKKKWLWLVVPHNCVCFVEQIVHAGGSSWGSFTNLPRFSAWGDKIKAALRPKQDEIYDFIGRFSTALRIGDHNVKTLNMDEEGLAKALVNEKAGDSAFVHNVFLRLDDKFNSDSDDVAEIYVNLVRQRGGAAAATLQGNKPLVRTLIKVLDEGWTTSGEQKCIDYLKTLLG